MKIAIGVAYRVGPPLVGLVLPSLAANQEDLQHRPKVEESTPSIERVSVAGIENVFRLSPRLYSGGQPEGAGSFSALKKLGVKTIISVDGAEPDIDAARRFGIRYIHLPVGYDGVPREQAVRIIKASWIGPGPVFIHCHHGKHRGPTAAALCGMAMEGWSHGQALAWMNRAGTSPEYQGLFATIDRFALPSTDELAKVGTEFAERAETPALVELMVKVDERWDHLKAIQEAGFQPTARHPDIDPPHEALQLAEHFREVLRLPESRGRGEDFVRTVESAERVAADLQSSLQRLGKSPTAESRKKADAAFTAVAKNCTTCHARHRNK